MKFNSPLDKVIMIMLVEGKEVFRHTGFMSKKQIVEILTRLGVS
jgi:hypothetical protein